MIHKREFRAMGCQMLAAMDTESSFGKRCLQGVPDWFEDWEETFSRFRPESELNRINKHSGQWVHTSSDFWRVFLAARQAEESSEGLVTPLVLDAMHAAGYTQNFQPVKTPGRTPGNGHSAPQGVLVAPRPVTQRARDIETFPVDRWMRLPQGAHLDFGGVAKGWAAQQAMKRLQIYVPALVDAGGDISVSGEQRDGSRWAVGVADPLHPGETLEILMVGRCGIATSGRDYRRWQQDGHWQHHIIDPRTGSPAETDVLSATVIAPDLLRAEMAAKTVLILGSFDGMAWLEKQAGCAGLLVLENGERRYSRGIERWLWRE